MATTIHRGMVVAGLINYYGDVLYGYDEGVTVKERLTKIADRLWQAYHYNNPVVLNQINNYNPKYLSRSWSAIQSEGFLKRDAYDTIANEYGYKTWKEVPSTSMNLSFEYAIDVMLAGDFKGLKQLLSDDPTLVEIRSDYAHRATLFHYLGSNGVELYRQVVPSNLAKIMTLLLDHGADHQATMPVYGGDFTMIDLLKTSAHPKAAGLHDTVVSAYENYQSRLSS